MIKLLSTLSLVLSVFFCHAEVADTLQTGTCTYLENIDKNIYKELHKQNPDKGHIAIQENSYIHELMELNLKLDKENEHISGYRIQIFSGSSYDYSVAQVTEMEDEFMELFPEVAVYLDYFDPDFKIRVGNFKTRLDCIPILRQVRRRYPACYAVRTDIPIEEIKYPNKNKVKRVIVPEESEIGNETEHEELNIKNILNPSANR